MENPNSSTPVVPVEPQPSEPIIPKEIVEYLKLTKDDASVRFAINEILKIAAAAPPQVPSPEPHTEIEFSEQHLRTLQRLSREREFADLVVGFARIGEMLNGPARNIMEQIKSAMNAAPSPAGSEVSREPISAEQWREGLAKTIYERAFEDDWNSLPEGGIERELYRCCADKVSNYIRLNGIPEIIARAAARTCETKEK